MPNVRGGMAIGCDNALVVYPMREMYIGDWWLAQKSLIKYRV
ncbi:hypothetical protein ACOT1K_13800 [Providencia manganoxydans]|nr:hypothetical protein [Providencia stuartii]